VNDTESTNNTASAPLSAAEDEQKEARRLKRLQRIEKIRNSLGSAATRLAYTPSEAAVACGRTPTWAYRKIYSGEFKVVTADGRMLIPRGEIDRFFGRADTYNPKKNTAEHPQAAES
jgi:hypothetical protein